MKHITIALGLSLLASAAFAGSTTSPKDSSSQGSLVGQASSSYTGNGATISGNGNGIGPDQTTSPGSRADEVHSVQGSTASNPGNSGHANR
jgi:hypothetical protein